MGGPGGTLAVHPETFEVINLLKNESIGPRPPLAGTPSAATVSSDGGVLALGYGQTDETDSFVDVIDVSEGALINRIEWERESFAEISELELIEREDLALLIELDDFILELWTVSPNERLIRTIPEVNEPAAGGGVISSVAPEYHRDRVQHLG